MVSILTFGLTVGSQTLLGQFHFLLCDEGTSYHGLEVQPMQLDAVNWCVYVDEV